MYFALPMLQQQKSIPPRKLICDFLRFIGFVNKNRLKIHQRKYLLEEWRKTKM